MRRVARGSEPTSRCGAAVAAPGPWVSAGEQLCCVLCCCVLRVCEVDGEVLRYADPSAVRGLTHVLLLLLLPVCSCAAEPCCVLTGWCCRSVPGRCTLGAGRKSETSSWQRSNVRCLCAVCAACVRCWLWYAPLWCLRCLRADCCVLQPSGPREAWACRPWCTKVQQEPYE